jgi:hypothetical protein
MPADKEYSGFLSDYSNLKPNPEFDGSARTFARADAQKNLRRYIAVIVDPVQVYLASNADESKYPEKARGVAARYFHKALMDAVSSAFPAADGPGPLVLVLRSALIGVDVGDSAVDSGGAGEGSFERPIDIGKVGIEMELTDSESGQQIAAMVDRENLGSKALIGSEHFSRDEKWAAAREALDGWAKRVRQFLDSAQTLSDEDAKRADRSYKPYSDPPGKQ